MKEYVLRKIIYRGFYDPLPNLDPENKIKFGVSALKICNVCLELHGRVVREIEEGREKRVRSFFRRMDILDEWRRLSLFESLHDVGAKFGGDIWLRYYEKLLREKGNSIDGKFERMVVYLYENYMKD